MGVQQALLIRERAHKPIRGARPTAQHQVNTFVIAELG